MAGGRRGAARSCAHRGWRQHDGPRHLRGAPPAPVRRDRRGRPAHDRRVPAARRGGAADDGAAGPGDVLAQHGPAQLLHPGRAGLLPEPSLGHRAVRARDRGARCPAGARALLARHDRRGGRAAGDGDPRAALRDQLRAQHADPGRRPGHAAQPARHVGAPGRAGRRALGAEGHGLGDGPHPAPDHDDGLRDGAQRAGRHGGQRVLPPRRAGDEQRPARGADGQDRPRTRPPSRLARRGARAPGPARPPAARPAGGGGRSGRSAMTVPAPTTPTIRPEGDAPMAAANESAGLTAIIGAGRMGLGIAESFVIAGLDVVFAEVTPERAQGSPARLADRMRAHVDAGLVDGAAMARAAQVRAADDIADAVRDADLVIECVTEDIGVKEGVLRACDAAAGPRTILASNTLSLNITTLAGFVERPERFLGMHWFNPPEWTPGVEVVPVEETGTEAVERVTGLLRGIGKRPAVVRPGVGFVANRLQMALFSEAVRCVEDGIAEPAEVDEVVRSCFGFRLPFFGPFQIATMAGLDIYRAVLQQHRDGLGERFLGLEALDEGFYAYEDPAAVAAERDRRYAALAELLERFPPQSF